MSVFSGLVFVASGKLKMLTATLEELIVDNGGSVSQVKRHQVPLFFF